MCVRARARVCESSQLVLSCVTTQFTSFQQFRDQAWIGETPDPNPTLGLGGGIRRYVESVYSLALTVTLTLTLTLTLDTMLDSDSNQP